MNSKHPTAQFPAADSLFGCENYAHSYVILNTCLRNPFDKPPKSLLEIPKQWRQKWVGDFPIKAHSFWPRRPAIQLCAEANRKALADSMTGDGTPDEWHLVFRLGAWGKGSVLNVTEDRAELVIDSGVTLVRPTADEIREYGRLRIAA